MTIKENISLKDFTTFKIGGNARFFCKASSEDELLEAIGFSKKHKVPFFILGGGSNILVPDAGFPGLVIKMELKGVVYEEGEKTTKAIVQAGENWDGFVADTVSRGLYGLENLSSIPGTVGAAPVQNIGAYGTEVKNTVESVYALDLKKDEFVTLSNAECRFDYRDSLFKKEKGRYVILSVTFVLSREKSLNHSYKDLTEYFGRKHISKPTLAQVRDAVVEIRKGKFPDLTHVGTAGSFFKNPVVSVKKAEELVSKYPEIITYSVNSKFTKIPLAWILDHVCGFKGKQKGSVGVYKNQALVLVNHGGAKAVDVIALAQEMLESVYEKTGIEIEPEVEYVEVGE
ncbi:MAG: UDP-N-acetylmuramate dehydrogenase [Patescibacteria group bacterium]